MRLSIWVGRIGIAAATIAQGYCSRPHGARSLPSPAGPPAWSEFYDPGAVVRIGTTVKVGARTNRTTALTNLESNELLSEKSLSLIDCAGNKIGAEGVMTYSGRDTTGTALGHMETPLRRTPIKAGTADEALMKTVSR